MSETYLFIPNLDDGRKAADEIVETFMKKAFLTDSVLVVLGKNEKTFSDYAKYTFRKVFNETCKIKFLYIDVNVSAKQFIKNMAAVILRDNSTEFFPYI